MAARPARKRESDAGRAAASAEGAGMISPKP